MVPLLALLLQLDRVLLEHGFADDLKGFSESIIGEIIADSPYVYMYIYAYVYIYIYIHMLSSSRKRPGVCLTIASIIYAQSAY